MKHTKGDLKQMQSLPLSAKILMTKRRIREWYEYFEGDVYVAFSGGKDSTVLLHMARELYPDIEAVFVNTGLEYPEIQKFVKTFDNVTILRPEMRFDEVIKTYGYPIISKAVSNCVWGARRVPNGTKYNQLCGTYETNGKLSVFNYGKYKPLLDMDCKISDRCCAVMKKRPMKKFQHESGKKPIVAMMATEGAQREMSWLRNGCNAFDSESPISKPMSFWTEQDVLQYIKKYNIPIASVYGDVVYADQEEQIRIEEYGIEGCGTEKLKTTGCDRTGCVFCAYGCHLEKSPSRFERLKETHPRQYEYCIGGGEYDENGIWQPNKQGLGMGHIFDELNKIYGEGFIKY
jgi:3'-phosphoadenosine 5'-phosphosulfate sulfotransferase (PAPS reductase)/FAD synthetase